MDGSRQRFRLYGADLRRWTIRLDLLDEQELAAVTAFTEQQGTAIFPFTDPVTGEQVTNCIISNQSYAAGMTDEFNANATLGIEEVG
jgi:hypothetical protein